MIRYEVGNIFDSGADCLVNTVNCEGFMGKGIAYQFKLRYPQNNDDYVKACKHGALHIGTIHTYKEDGIWIVNLPTKNKWRENSKINYIEVGLDCLGEFIRKEEPKKVAIPPLGCGNGGLDWKVVKPIISEKLKDIEDKYNIIVYEPSISYNVIPKEPPKLNVSALSLLLIRMNLQKFDSLRLQKSCFFVNYFLGEEYYHFDKWKYGPYSHSIDIVAKAIKEYQMFYNLSDSKETYDQVYKVLCSKKVEEKLNKLMPAIKMSTEYINGIKTDKMVEGVATVMYLVQKNCNQNADGIISLFKEWSKDKSKRFTEQYIQTCIDYLEKTNIIQKNIFGHYIMKK